MANKKRTLGLSLAIVLLLLVAVCIGLYSAFSLRPSVVGSIRAEDAELDNGTGAMLDVELFPTMGLPFRVMSLTVQDTTEQKDLPVQIYFNNNETSPWSGMAMLFSAEEAAALVQQNVLLPLATPILSGEGNWFVVLFPDQAPSRSHTVQFQISYRLFGLFPKTETFPCVWL